MCGHASRLPVSMNTPIASIMSCTVYIYFLPAAVPVIGTATLGITMADVEYLYSGVQGVLRREPERSTSRSACHHGTHNMPLHILLACCRKMAGAFDPLPHSKLH